MSIKKQQWHEFATGAQHWDLRQSWILDFHAVDSGFQVLDSNFCQWNLGSGFQSLVGFRIPWAVFRGAIHSTKIPTGNGPVFRDFSGWIEPIHWVLDLNFRQFWFKWIAPPDSSCKMFRDSGFHEQQFHGFLNPVIPQLERDRALINLMLYQNTQMKISEKRKECQNLTYLCILSTVKATTTIKL